MAERGRLALYEAESIKDHRDGLIIHAWDTGPQLSSCTEDGIKLSCDIVDGA